MSRIAFTSCIRRKNKHDMQPQWQAIIDADPDYLLLTGDHIYMDFGYWPFSREYTHKPKSYSANEFRRIMQEKYELQWAEPHFKTLIDKMKAKNGLIATWDDHDFAWNNACGAQVPDEIKTISRELFHHYLGKPENDAYQSALNPQDLYGFYDIPGARIIVLDTRFYAEEACLFKPDAKLLGDQQWQFLTQALQHTAPLTLIVSAISLTKGGENWQRYRKEYQKLQDLLRPIKGAIVIAGDIHSNALLAPDKKRPCYELIASGMAVNQLGLPFGITDQRNWGLMDIDSENIAISLHSKRGKKSYQLDQERMQLVELK